MKRIMTLSGWLFCLACFPLAAQSFLPIGWEVPAIFLPIEEDIAGGNGSMAIEKCKRLLSMDLNLRDRGILLFLTGETYSILDQPGPANEVWSQAEAIFEQIKSPEALALVLNKKASLHLAQEEIETADKLFTEATNLAEKAAVFPLIYEIYQNRAILYSGRGNHKRSMQCLHAALKAVQQLKDQEKIQSVYNLLSTNFYSIGLLDSAIVYFHKLIDLKKELNQDQNLISDLSALGKLYQEQGNYLQAQTHLMEALRLGEANTDTFMVMSLCTDIGSIYSAQKIWEKTFEYTQKALDLANLKGLSLIKAQNLKTQAYAYQQTGEIDIAIDRYNEALTLFKNLRNTINVADLQLEISKLLRTKENYLPALQYAKEALEIREGTGDRMGILHAQLVLGELELKLGNPKYAIRLLQNCLAISKDMNNLNAQRKTCALLSEANAAIQDHEAAYFWHQKYAVLHDSILSTERTKAITELELLYETEKKDIQLIAQNTDLQLKEAQIRRRNSQLLFLGIILGLVLLSTAFLYFIIQKNKLLHKQRLEVVHKKQETQRLQAVIEGEEKERKRIARELHDGLGAVLATVKMQMNALENELPSIRERQGYKKAENLLDNACHTVREISHNMVPSVLEQYGLEYAITEMCDTIEKANQISIDFIPFGLKTPLSNILQITIYRIVQELLRNVVRHAEASEVIVQLTIENNHLNLIVEDDGIGFHPQEPGFKPGIGLDNIFSRVKYFDGQVVIQSTPKEGTTFTIDIPNLKL